MANTTVEPKRLHATAYAGTLRERSEVTGSEEPFLHLGHWDDPTQAHPDLRTAQRRLDDELQHLARLENGQRVLDVACGVGGTVAAIADRLPSSRLIGVDLDAWHLVKARQRLAEVGAQHRALLCRADACSLPFADGIFDRILCVEAAFHFPSRERFLREAKRVLRPGGLLAMSDIVPGPRLRQLAGSPEGTDIARRIERGLGPWPDFWGEEGAAPDLAERAGLTLLANRDASRSTLPSYRCFLRDVTDRSPDLCPMDDALLALEELQARDQMRVTYQVFQAQR